MIEDRPQIRREDIDHSPGEVRGIRQARPAMRQPSWIPLRVGDNLGLDSDTDYLMTLMSIAYRRPIDSAVLHHVKAAADHWHRGEKALATIRLAFGGLHRIDDPTLGFRLQSAEWLIDEGVSPSRLRKELDLGPTPAGVSKYDPDQPRVPAGSGQESGQWRRIWDAVSSWLQDPVPVYDADTGIQYGTRSRARAIASNPVTVGAAGAATFLAAEAASTAAAFSLLPATGKGLVRADRVLREMGLTRNTVAVRTQAGGSVPDALTETQSIEIKDRAYVTFTKQLRIQTDAAEAAGRESVLITGEQTTLSKNIPLNFDKVIRRSDLGRRK